MGELTWALRREGLPVKRRESVIAAGLDATIVTHDGSPALAHLLKLCPRLPRR